MNESQARKMGYYLTRGSYSGTTDNRIDRWYWQRTDSSMLDYRGEGYASKSAALAALDQALNIGTEREQ